LHFAAQANDGRYNCDGDQRGEETIFDRGGAGPVGEESLELIGHDGFQGFAETLL
jgi:hypothetical protein